MMMKYCYWGEEVREDKLERIDGKCDGCAYFPVCELDKIEGEKGEEEKRKGEVKREKKEKKEEKKQVGGRKEKMNVVAVEKEVAAPVKAKKKKKKKDSWLDVEEDDLF